MSRLLLFLLFLCAALGAGAAPVAVRKGAPVDAVRYSFGSVSPADTPILRHTFVLRNTGGTPLMLTRFVPSCHCTTVQLAPHESLPFSLAPGAQVDLFVQVVVESYMSGNLDKYVNVYADHQSSPIATLTLAARLHPLVVLNPPHLEFGLVPAGERRSLTLTATIDTRLLDGKTAPTLAGSDPDLRIIPQGTASASDGTATRTFIYRVDLASHAALGPLQDLLQFSSTPDAPTVTGLALSDGPAVSVTGQVVGAASASSSEVAFGVVVQGRAVTLPVRLSSREPGLLMSAHAISPDTDLDLAWGRERQHMRPLYVSLSPKAPPGPVQSQVIVSLANGQRLRLPVSAYISASQK